MSKKLLPPVAVCTDCRSFNRNAASINQRCGHKYDGKRCSGVWGSSLSTTDWKECKKCKTTGYLSNEKCTTCGGFGWEYCRK